MTLLEEQIATVETCMPMGVSGTVTAVRGLTIEASDLPLATGSMCVIRSHAGHTTRAEVIGFDSSHTLLMPLGGLEGIARGDRVELVTHHPRIVCSHSMLGRVIDGMGRPIDGRGPLPPGRAMRVDARSVTPLSRKPIREPLYTGVRAIDTLHTCGRGQRMGIFSGPGVGKSTLMSQISRNTSADVSVVALIGERGREVQEFIEHAMGEEGMKRCVMIVSTSDDTPLLKVRAARVACTVAEFFRDAGKHVLLMMDSLTRLAQAQRQIGLAAREPPATRGFPPSVFAILPEILERAGQTNVGSVTGFYTVLVEGDDFNEPIPDAVKGITDGHLLLSRTLATQDHFPAIDVLQSISRVRGDVCPRDRVEKARKVLKILADFKQIEDLVSIGAYVKGSNAESDLALEARGRVIAFLKQSSKDALSPEAAMKQHDDLCAAIDLLAKSQTSQKARQDASKT